MSNKEKMMTVYGEGVCAECKHIVEKSVIRVFWREVASRYGDFRKLESSFNATGDLIVD